MAKRLMRTHDYLNPLPSLWIPAAYNIHQKSGVYLEP